VQEDHSLLSKCGASGGAHRHILLSRPSRQACVMFYQRAACAIFLILIFAGCSEHQGAVLPTTSALTKPASHLRSLETSVRDPPLAQVPVIGSHTVDYRAAEVPPELATWIRSKFRLGPVGRSLASTKKPVKRFTFLESHSSRVAASVRHVSTSTCYFLLTFTNYDDGTSELTNVDVLGCIDDGSAAGGTAGGGSGSVGGLTPGVNEPTFSGCSDLRKTADSFRQNILSTPPGTMNTTSNVEAFSYIFVDNAGNYRYDAVQNITIDPTTGEGYPGPARQYDGFTLVGIVHTHPQDSPVDNLGDATNGTHFSQKDFNFAT